MTTDSRRDRRCRIVGRVLTVSAVLFVLFALLVPNDLSRLTPGEFLRIPVEGLLGAVLVLVLPPRPRQVVAAVAGAALGLLLIMKFLDMGFNTTLGRTFDPLFDWSFLGPGLDFLGNAVGRAGAIAVAVGIGILVVAIILLMTLAAMRVSRLAVGHRTATTRTVAVLGVVWIFAASFSLPIASKDTAALAYAHAGQVRTGLKDHQAFTAEVSADAFRATPGNELLTGLRGKDVMVTFVESYGRVAVEGQDIAAQVDATLDAGTAKLRAAGFSSRSAFLTSSTFGGGSWFAHSTLQSGVWINNQQRYDNLLAGDRLTLSGAFQRAGWRTVGQLPQNTKDWPEGKFYGYDQYYDGRNVGYKGPNFFYAAMPDQYTLSAFQRLERSTPGHAPVMAEIALVSSHTPWTPVADLVDWREVGDGSIFKPMPEKGKKMEDVWPDPVKVRAAYTESIQYSLNTLISYVQTYGDDNLVLVFLGDHQPAPIVAGENASRDVPVTIVARDPAVLAQITGWGWQDGLNPGQHAPVWPMNTFRDRFLTTFGPHATPAAR